MKVHKGERISPLYWWMAFPPVAFAFYAFIIFSLCRRLFVFSPSVFVFLSFPGVIRGRCPLIVCGDPEFLTQCNLLYKVAKTTLALPSPVEGFSFRHA